jgi:phosphate acetyltransferase
MPDVAIRKNSNSQLKGQANILIFPNLDSGNIAYKLVERLGNAQAFGPLLQGINQPINDLSRGCSIDDIVTTIAITSVQATSNLSSK